ncbi:unnamed protein product [Lactuca virosa]|uniref:Uncharacterized protein n=1 Tax=Lactuca virosa TaxID=75947 RepID=A0AAU9PPE0_9ASTR|nr:unnamed protein product [Lactuca virosa]
MQQTQQFHKESNLEVIFVGGWIGGGSTSTGSWLYNFCRQSHKRITIPLLLRTYKFHFLPPQLSPSLSLSFFPKSQDPVVNQLKFERWRPSFSHPNL